MIIAHSDSARAGSRDPVQLHRLAGIQPRDLAATVADLSYPRHFVAEAARNREAADWIAARFTTLGYDVALQGRYRNVLALPHRLDPRRPAILVGAHYDSVPGSPGADDNASAVAAMLAVARAVADLRPAPPVVFVAFNREEDGLVGSQEFVHWLHSDGPRIGLAHILEMVGYCRHDPHTQTLPAALSPFLARRVPTTGDFLGLLASRGARDQVDSLLDQAHTYLPDLPVVALKIPRGLDRRVGVLRRSDHAPFWDAGIPATMWTDTSEFRNPHYHTAQDTPETLDYPFLAQVSRLLLLSVLAYH